MPSSGRLIFYLQFYKFCIILNKIIALFKRIVIIEKSILFLIEKYRVGIQMEKDLRIKSQVYSEGAMKAPNRAMLRAVGVTDEDFKKPMIGVASTWSEVTPCNIHINDLAVSAKEGAKTAGGVPMIFNTITVSDGISMGTRSEERRVGKDWRNA